ncbi:hypothetical protein [Ferrimicrobium sp.]|uniref:hypothetical protein n=1 Tax=Ferrimicrobium sp. TaxID=2926050 RepID=UPI00260816D5|nr:hypothetical protein [Ferrimicrobium sp.]
MFRLTSLNNDDGLGIVELVLAMALTGVLSLITYKVITSFDTIQQVTLSSQAATASADLGSTELTRLLSQATTSGDGALLAASPSSVSFDAIDASGQLGIEDIWATTTQCPCQVDAEFITQQQGSAPITNLGFTIASPTLFSYYQTPPSPSQLAQAQITVPAAGTTNSTILAGIQLVGIDITEDVIDQGTSSTQTLVALPGSTQPSKTTEEQSS